MASMNDMTQDQRNGAGIKAHTITKVRWFLTSKISSTPLNWRIIANALIDQVGDLFIEVLVVDFESSS